MQVVDEHRLNSMIISDRYFVSVAAQGFIFLQSANRVLCQSHCRSVGCRQMSHIMMLISTVDMLCLLAGMRCNVFLYCLCYLHTFMPCMAHYLIRSAAAEPDTWLHLNLHNGYAGCDTYGCNTMSVYQQFSSKLAHM